MAGKFKKIILRSIAAILIFAAIVTASGYAFIKLYVIPEYNNALGENASESEKLTEKDVIGFAKYLTDAQLIKNFVNFDKNSAKDLLDAVRESEDDEAHTPTPKPASGRRVWNKRVTARIETVPTPTPTPTPTPEPTSVPKKSEVKGSTAYERIMNTASKEEISAGMAILAKVDMGKVNQLRSQGKMGELKKYIKSVLTSAEIKKALLLYNKYHHLL